jgi:UDP-glucose 4-epimerase
MTTPLSWVVGAGGLLGSNVVRALEGDGRIWSPAVPVPWADPDAAARQLHGAAMDFLDAADGGPWQVAWCAGAGVTATSLAHLERELAFLDALLDGLRTARGGTFFLASSAGALYAGSQDPPFDEATPIAPISEYGRVKARMEARVADWAADTGGRAVVGRIANLYGPGQGLEKPQGLISHIVRSQLNRSPISIYVSLDTMRDYVFAQDCGELVRDVLRRLRSDETPEGTVVTKILASHQQVTVGRILSEVRRIFKRSPQVVLGSSPQAALQAHDLRLRSRVWPELDRRPLTPLGAGILATTAHLRTLQRAGRL